MVLCMNPRSDNNEALVIWETIALDVRSGVNFLRKQPGITKVLTCGRKRRRADHELLSSRRGEGTFLLSGT